MPTDPTLPGSSCPADGHALPPVHLSPPEHVRDLVDRVRAAQPAWAALSVEERGRRLVFAAREVLDHRAEILDLLFDETGRSRTESMINELATLMDYARGAVAVGKEALAPEKVKLNPINFPGKKVLIEAVPRGVVGIVEPWNFPLLQFYKPLFPALLAGNAVVLKPSEHTPRSGAWLAARVRDALGHDVVGVALGAGEVGAALVDAVDAVVFCGSVATGRKVAARCAERLIPCSLELGGKDAAIVLADCDLDRTVAGVVFGALNNAGQDCSSIERVYVEERIADQFVARVGAVAAALRVSPSGEHADIGPLQNPAQLAVVEDHVADAIARGARCITGGERTGPGLGYLPTVLDRCAQGMKVIDEETFGPVIAIVRVPDADDAVRQANTCRYGLAGSVWTSDVERGARLARRLDVGMALVNNHSFAGTVPQIPWTGTKESGTGVAASRHAYPTFVRRRTLVVDRNASPELFWKPVDADLDEVAHRVADMGLGALHNVVKLLPLVRRRIQTVAAFSKG